jgi:predicted permease
MREALWRWVEARLRRSLPPAHASSTLGDLAEDFAHRCASTGRLRASLWLIAEARSLRRAYRVAALEASPASPGSWRAAADDVRHAWKRLVARPAMPLVCASLLALGIGLSTAMFSVVDSLLLRPAPFPDADRLVRQWLWRTEPDVMAAWRASGLFDAVEAARLRPLELSTDAGTMTGAFVTPGVFDLLQVRAVRGRLFGIHDAQPGSDGGVVLSETIWRSSFGGDPDVIGRRARVGDESLIILGIAPADLRFPTPATVAWRAFDPASGGPEPTTIFGRLAPGISHETAAASTETIARALVQVPGSWSGVPPLQPVPEPVSDALTRRGVWLLFGGVALVYVVLCGNVCTLLLSRLSKRQREFATLTALGASRVRLIRQATVEHTVIGSAGAAAGIVLATGLTRWMPELFQQRTLNLIDVDVRALVAASGLGLASVVVAGLAPAWLGTRAAPADALRGSRQGGGDTPGARMLTRGLLAAQVALACSLLVGSTLLLRSFQELATTDRGLTLDGIVTVNVAELDRAFSPGPAMALGTAAIGDAVRSWPEIDAVALSRELPPSWSDARVRIDGAMEWDAAPRADRYRVGDAYFEVYSIPILRGRAFAESEPDAVVISERLAALFWPGRNPVGERLEIAGMGPARVVGVAREVRLPTLDAELDRPEFYVPLGSESRTLYLSLRCRIACPSEPLMRDRLAAIHPAIVPRLRPPIGTAFAAELELPRAVARIAGVFAVVALLTAGGGLFSVMTAVVARRRREFGIRTALGAAPAQTRRSVLVDALRLAGPGVAAGVAGGFAIARSLSAFQYGVTSTDPVSWTVVLTTIAAASLAAAWRPAVEAARVDPAELLREE